MPSIESKFTGTVHRWWNFWEILVLYSKYGVISTILVLFEDILMMYVTVDWLSAY